MTDDYKQTSADSCYREGDVVLRDGSTVHVRPIRPDDELALLDLFRSLSEQSRWLRFFSPVKDLILTAEARREATVDYCHTFGLVATGPEDRMVGHALYAVLNAEAAKGGLHAEVAFAVTDDFQGRGLGTILLGQLAEIASKNGITVFEAEVLSANHRMIEVFRQSGFHVEVTVEAGQLHVTFPTELTAGAIERFDQRERIAAARALKLFFNPQAVAVIGASRDRDSIGGVIFQNLLSYGFQGPVFPVNPSAEVVQSVPAYPTVEAIPQPVDLAVIVVPAAGVIKAAEQCARKGVHALVVISAEFAEMGGEGHARQAELLRICRAAGMRLIGPNCMGIINTDPAVRLDATFARPIPPTGRVGFSSQSGALGLAIIEYARRLGLGLSTFVSVGNKADISGNDLLRYWEEDPNTDVILLYLESFGKPKKFSKIARRVGRKKPIVAVKSGRFAAGARATSSHTGALLAASDITVDALFRQAGVIRTDTLEELFDVASLLANQPLPKGRRVGILTNGGGPAILCADACEARNLEVPVLESSTQARLREFLPAGASATNPVDLIASATAEDYHRAISVMAGDPNLDALIVIFIPPLATKAEDAGRAIAEAVREMNRSKPVMAVFMSERGMPDELRAAGVSIPSYTFPENAAMALSHVARYGEWREHAENLPPRFDDLRGDEAAAIVANALTRGDGWLTGEETLALLSCYGLPLVRQRVVTSAEEAGAAAEEFGCEVVLKAIAPGLLHKTEMRAVQLNLKGAEQVRVAANEMAERLGARGQLPTGFVVQQQITGGIEMLVGVVHDPQFGPVVACGVGGVQVELMRDVSIRLTPLTLEDASEMIRGLKSYPLLDGFRGGPRHDVVALEEGLLRVSAMVEDLPQIAELDLNPFVVREKGAVILDARVRVVNVEPPPLFGSRG
ncbi:MAG TPA: GNAT family N-acetyltransferase [Blastocatellia bacterium]|nr:GNAT family N-acetyltransferase [Blastocatellia bacterium]